ncbi:uncharacterized protein LOC133091840 [Eubalaena glacialis]|uniref:uncharacterized protein LOC133091840 n=1 Tax=Eubalaena glacialis TaxID=27606 RepID=UPI002A5A75DE|nr:uncharacterized protein LOC133091840 [Eubalaena glacialis]
MDLSQYHVSAVPPTTGDEVPLSVQAQVPASDTQGPTCPLSAQASPSARSRPSALPLWPHVPASSSPQLAFSTATSTSRVNWLRLEQLRTPQGDSSSVFSAAASSSKHGGSWLSAQDYSPPGEAPGTLIALEPSGGRGWTPPLVSSPELHRPSDLSGPQPPCRLHFGTRPPTPNSPARTSRPPAPNQTLPPPRGSSSRSRASAGPSSRGPAGVLASLRPSTPACWHHPVTRCCRRLTAGTVPPAPPPPGQLSIQPSVSLTLKSYDVPSPLRHPSGAHCPSHPLLGGLRGLREAASAPRPLQLLCACGPDSRGPSRPGLPPRRLCPRSFLCWRLWPADLGAAGFLVTQVVPQMYLCKEISPETPGTPCYLPRWSRHPLAALTARQDPKYSLNLLIASSLTLLLECTSRTLSVLSSAAPTAPGQVPAPGRCLANIFK